MSFLQAYAFPACILLLVLALIRRIAIPKAHPTLARLPSTRWLVGDVQPLFAFFKQTGQLTPYFEGLSKARGGKPFVFYWPGSMRRPMVCVSDPRDVEGVLLNKSGSYERSRLILDCMGTIAPLGMVALPSDKMWKVHRRLFGPAMASKNLKLVTPDILSCVQTLMDLWTTKLALMADDSAHFACSRDLSNLSTDIITGLAFGQSYCLLDGTLELVKKEGKLAPGQPFLHSTNPLAEASTLFFQSLPFASVWPAASHLFDRLSNPPLRAAERTLTSFLSDKIKKGRIRVREGLASEGLLDSVLEKEMEEQAGGGKLLEVKELIDELNTFIIAGEETTATTMGWMIKYLSQNRDVQLRLHQEVLSSFPSEQDLSFDRLASGNTPYLDAVLAEALRLSKTLSATYRTALEDTVIDGHRIEKGTDLALLVGLAGRKVAKEKPGPLSGWVTDDTDSFRPERWLDAGGQFDAKAGPSMPFASGPRGCYGLKLANLELRAFLVTLSQTFFLEALPDHLADENDEQVHELSTRALIEVWVKPVPWMDKTE